MTMDSDEVMPYIRNLHLIGPPNTRASGKGLSMSVEPRYNLATKVMSNGVEVIVAGDRSTRPGEPEYLRLLSSTVTRPITLAPHTLSHHMSMLLPADLQSENEAISSLNLQHRFNTRTLYTSYIYPTKLEDGKNTESGVTIMVVTNVKQINAEEPLPTNNVEVTLSASPVLESHVEKTVFTYLNTVMDGDQPLVATSKQTVVNTFLAPSPSLEALEPSEVAPETNTYYSTREFTRTVTDGTDSQVVSTTDVLTRVIITDPPSTEVFTTDPGTIDVTKTYFATYTYFSTYVEGDETKVSSHVSVSTDVAVEKFTIKNKKSSSTIEATPSALLMPTKSVETAQPERLSSEPDNDWENSIGTPELDDDDQLASSSGDIIDDWYEKFKIKSTESDITKTKTKTKTTIKHKLKTKSTTKVTSSSISPTSTYSTSVIISSTVTPQGATLAPGDQVIVLYGENGQTSLIPLSDPVKKKTKNDTEPANDMLGFGSLGINSINVLGPVFNAMAEALKNHQKEALKKRNDTVPIKKSPNPNPLLSFMSNLAGTNPPSKTPPTSTTLRSPLYIPVGSIAEDSSPSESEGRISILPKPEKWVQEKWPSKPTHQLDKNRRTHDNSPMPHLEGGIPISPGQVITTNSDVIIGRPSDSGPRPPNFAIKDNAPVDMKPPPFEEQRVHLDPVGQFSTNQGVDPSHRPVNELLLKPPPKSHPMRPPAPPIHHQKPSRPHQQHQPQAQHPPKPHMQHQPVSQQQSHGLPHRPVQNGPHDSGDFDLNPPPPPPNIQQQGSLVPIPIHLNPDEIIENYVNPVHFQPDNLALPNEVIPTPTIPREISKVIERGSGHPLLVNIQPSQVAQVVIPHGSSTAVIISEEQPHATKGEVIDDPKPHPEPETVGFIGAEPLLKVDANEISHRPVNSMLEIIKSELPIQQHQPKETVNIRPRPDYDNIGMKPPNEPRRPLVPMSQIIQHQEFPPKQHFTQPKKDPSGIYVDISPPGHLPPPPKGQRPTNQKPLTQHNPPESLANHQSGVVHDVPLIAQVQLGSGHSANDKSPLNEIIVNFDGVPFQKEENVNHAPRPVDSVDLVPPPPPPKPVKHIPNNHVPIHGQAFPTHHGKTQYPNVAEPSDFMKPPPKPTISGPVVIPIGAGAINPSNRPGEIMMGQPSEYQDEEDMEANADDPFKTEDGEEIQESNARPLLPGQIPNELKNHTSKPEQINNIGVSQTLSFGNNNDKVDENNSEPETIIGSQMHSGGGSQMPGFGGKNEAVLFVGTKPSSDTSAEVDMDELEKMFGMKLPTGPSANESSVHSKPMKPDEVMGMSPPPVERPRRPSRPRPSSPFKFENPNPPSLLSPISMDNDFPPVRSPDLGKKPFKPEDVFPPKLPDNFVYREYEISTRKPVQKRPYATSMPIDSPSSTTTENSNEVNGHSKPVTSTENHTEDEKSPPIERPKPVVHDRPTTVHAQKPIRIPLRPPHETAPSRGPPPKYHHPPKDGPSRGQPDSSNRGQPHPFPFERPSAHEEGSFGDKMRPPSQQMSPPKPKPPTARPTIEQPIKRPPYEHIPIRAPEHPNGLEPPRPPNVRPPTNRPPSLFEQPPRPTTYTPPVRPPDHPPRLTASGSEQVPSRPIYEQPPNRPHPFEHAQASPTRAPPAFERPLPPPSEFEQPPPREQNNLVEQHREQNPHRHHSTPSTPPAEFKPPPKRVEPSPHFENQPAQGHLHQQTTTTQKAQVTESPEKKVPPFLHRPVQKPTETISIGKGSTDIDQTPERNEPVIYEKRPPSRVIPTRRPTLDSNLSPSSEQPQYKPTPTVKPARIPIPSREKIRPTPVKEPEESTINNTGVPNIVTSMITSGSTTIFGDLYTDPLLLQPTKVITSSQGIQFSVPGFPGDHSQPQKVMVVSTPPVSFTHTTTLTVTSTMTTVLHSSGQVPITKTVLLTTTLISTIVDKVTETETLVKPTTSTVTQTHTISTTKTALVVPTAIYPPRPVKYPSAKPEIFVADVHDKRPEPQIIIADPHEKIAKPEIFVADPRDKDTMTISVSSSMNKKDKKKEPHDKLENESILVVVSDKPPSGGKPPNILLGGVLAPPEAYPRPSATECLPECRPTRNERCIKQDGLMKCVCRPGFARMFPDQPCKPTYTYSMQVTLDRMGTDPVQFQQGLQIPGTPKFVRMSEAAKEGLNRMIMQSDLRDIYHGMAVSGFQPKEKKTMVDFFVQLSENVDDGKVLGMFRKALRTSNFSLGGTEMFAAREADNVLIQDFNECLNNKFHDCSEHSRCFNLKGTYTCSCKEGFTDISENPSFPGRLCSDLIGCEYCGYHGTCYTRGEQQTCECFQWYSGDRCRINLKVLLIALVTIGAILLALLLVCIIMTCIKRRSSSSSRNNGSTGYLRYRGPPQSLDKRAMIVDTSSESSVENLPYVTAPPPPPLPQPVLGPPRKPALRQGKRPAPRPQQVPVDQRDRSLTVMIPRVKYRTAPPAPAPGHLTMSTFSPDKHLNRTAAQIATEQKLMNYLDGNTREGGVGGPMQRPSKEEKRIYDVKPSTSHLANRNKEPRVYEYEYKTSNMHITDGTSSGERRSKDDRFRRYSDQTPLHHDTNSLQHRKYSAGALVSAGYAVSATGGLIQDAEESTIHSNTLKSNRSQFTTLNRSGDHKTMSEARSYDETLIQPQTRPLRTNYSGSSSSRLHPDENHTMVERDLGSTFLLPESHLFKPAGDRGSDISNFDSL